MGKTASIGAWSYIHEECSTLSFAQAQISISHTSPRELSGFALAISQVTVNPRLFCSAGETDYSCSTQPLDIASSPPTLRRVG